MTIILVLSPFLEGKGVCHCPDPKQDLLLEHKYTIIYFCLSGLGLLGEEALTHPLIPLKRKKETY